MNEYMTTISDCFQLLNCKCYVIFERVSHSLSGLREPLSLHLPPPPAYTTRIWMDTTNPNHPDSLKIGESLNYNFITVLDAQTTIESGTTGLRTWPASLLLAEVLISHPGCILYP